MADHRWLLFALLGALFAAITNVIVKKGLDGTDHTAALTVQAMLMLVTMVVATTIRSQWSALREASTTSLVLMGAAGVLSALSWFFGYRALQLADVARTAPIDKLSMPMAVILAFVLLRERPTMMNWLGVALMVGGAFLVARSSAK